MSNFELSIEWLSSNDRSPILRDTSGQLSLHVDGVCLTRNEDIWSRTVRDTVLICAYPLALWLASSWWRLNHEPMHRSGSLPSLDWRMTHELGAANHGYVWPRIIFASDGEGMKVWAEPLRMDKQSVQYLYGLDSPRIVALEDFQRRAGHFIEAVLSRLNATGHDQTDLAQLWAFIQEDQNDPVAHQRRILEARLGCDPEQCPSAIIEQVLVLQARTGITAMAELAPVIGLQGPIGKGLEILECLASQRAIVIHPELPNYTHAASGLPWLRGAKAARQLRAELGNIERPVDNAELYALLGMTGHQGDHGSTGANDIAAFARPQGHGSFSMITRKKHPAAKRFEYARFIAEMFGCDQANHDWLVSTDISTARQQYQRAFAAEFLCPVESLVGYLEGDLSESSCENAAAHFNVSERTVLLLLANSGYLDNSSIEPRVPYRLVRG